MAGITTVRLILHALILALTLVEMVQAGTFKELNTDGTGKTISVSTMGVPVAGANSMLFEIKGQGNAIIILSEDSHIDTTKGKYYAIYLGTKSRGGGNRGNGIKDGSIKTRSYNKMELMSLMKNDSYSEVWISWKDGHVRVGDGTDIHQLMPLLDYQSPNKYRVYFIYVMSVSMPVLWRFRIDSAPSFKSPSPSGSTGVQFTEDTPLNTTIFSLVCEDAEGDNITYSLKNHQDMFRIDDSSIVLHDNLDYEKTRHYHLVIEAFDGLYTVPVSMVVNVTDVNDEVPVLTFSDHLIIPEEMPIGAVIGGIFSASDKDSDDTLTYDLKGPGTSMVEFVNNSLILKGNIDRDMPNEVQELTNLTFVVKDNAGHTAKAVKTLKIMDINDNAPGFYQNIYNLEITENGTSNKLLTKIQTLDIDEAENGKLSLTLKVPERYKSFFNMTGDELFANEDKIDLEEIGLKNSLLKFSVEAQDNPTTGLAKTSTASIYITVLSKNEYEPTWSKPDTQSKDEFKSISVLENITVLSTVTQFQAEDLDVGVDGEIRYTLLNTTTGSGGSLAPVFSLDDSTGILRTIALLDADANNLNHIVIVVEASDRGNNSKSVTGTLSIELKNINDNPPAFNSSLFEVEVESDLTADELVVNITAIDPDRDNITYNVAGINKQFFEHTGHGLKAMKNLSKQRPYFVEIRATDGVNEVGCVVAIYSDNYVSQTTQNASSLVSIEARAGISLVEELPIGLPLPALFHVRGLDPGVTASYSLEGKDSAYFNIDTTSGDITMRTRLDSDNSTRMFLDDLVVKLDVGGQLKKESLNLTVVDINDNEPRFEETIYFVNITENSTETVLTDLKVFDADSGENGNVTLSITNGDTALFSITNQSLVMDGSKVDLERMGVDESTMSVVVTGADNPDSGLAKSGETTVIVKVLSKNEYTPVWKTQLNVTSPTVHVTVETPVGSVLHVISASDEDRGEAGLVTYRLVNVTADDGKNYSSIFTMDPESGAIRTTSSLKDTPLTGVNFFDLTVKATDRGDPPRHVSGSVRVLLDSMDRGPHFDQVFYELEVLESTTVGSVIANISVMWSSGHSQELSVQQVGGNESEILFGFENDSLVLKGSLDYEETRVHLLIISASDDGGTRNSTVMVRVQDTMDEVPVITVEKKLSVPEELPVGTAFGGYFTSKDADVHDTLKFSISGNDSSYFFVNEKSGVLFLFKRLDRDGPNGKHIISDLVLTATDSAGNVASVNVTINVTDLNDNAPSLGDSAFYTSVKENSPNGTVILPFNISDADQPNASVDSFFISFGSGNDLGIFSIEGNDIVANGELIDSESRTNREFKYVLPILVVDHPGSSDSRVGGSFLFVSVIPVNEYSPTWLLPYETNTSVHVNTSLVDSEKVGSLVARVEATDLDWGDDGEIQYEILAVTGETDKNYTDLFRISPQTGAITVAKPLSVLGLGERINISFRAVDKGSPSRETSGEAIVTILSSNKAPEFLQDVYQIETAEDASLNQTLFNLTVFDAEGDNLTLSVGTGGSEYFKFEDLGLVLVKELDYEEEERHLISVEVSDGQSSDTATVLVRVKNVFDELPIISLTNISISEELAPGALIDPVFEVTDRDRDDSHSYNLTGEDAKLFHLDESTGEMRVRVRLNADGLTGTSYLDNLILTVTDRGGHNLSVNLNIPVVDLNDNPPRFLQDVFNVNFTENGDTDHQLLQLNTTDADKTPSENISLAIQHGNEFGVFRLEGHNLLVNSSVVDLEQGWTDSLFLVLKVSETTVDGRELSTSAVVTVDIESKNEFSPSIRLPKAINGTVPIVSVSKEDPVGTLIVHVLAEDDDVGTDGVILYSMNIASNDSVNSTEEYLSIDGDTGVVTLSKTLENRNITSLNVTVTASDKGHPSKSSSIDIQIRITEGTNRPPIFHNVSLTTEVREDTPVGTAVLNITVTDPDNDQLEFQVRAPADRFFIMEESQLVLNRSLKNETMKTIVVPISVTDGKRTVGTVVLVERQEVFDSPPDISVSADTTLLEGLPLGSVLPRVVTVHDSDLDDSLVFTLSGNDSAFFDIDNKTGDLILSRIIDYDGGNGVQILDDLKVTVIDKGGNSNSANLSFSIVDVNDNVPVCVKTFFDVQVVENTDTKESLLYLDCYDDDLGDNQTMAAEFVHTTSNMSFKIEQMNIYANFSDADYELLPTTELFLTIEITDRPNTTNPNIERIVIRVVITGKNEFEPQWVAPSPDTNNTFPPVSVARDAEIGSVITVFKVKDDDLGLDGHIHFNIESIETDSGNNVTGVFSLEDDTGVLRLNQNLLKNQGNTTITYYNVLIVASDRGQERKSINGTLRIDIQPVRNQAPVFEKHVFSVIISETAEVGDVVVEVNVTDPEGEEVTVTIVDAYSDVFSFNGTAMVLKNKLDFEKTRYCVVQIRSNDGDMESTSVVYLTVNNTFDEAPFITMETNLTIKEELLVNTELTGWFLVVDLDKDDNLTYSLSGNDSDYLSINANSGVLKVAQRLNADGLNGVKMLQDLTLTVIDKGGNAANATFNVAVKNVNDNSPKCSQSIYHTKIMENTSYNGSILHIDCHDNDPGDNDTMAAELLNTNTNITFHIEEMHLYVNMSDVDYESLQETEFFLTVLITDHQNTTTTNIVQIAIHILITGKNEFEPQWVAPTPDGNNTFPAVSVARDAEIGSLVTVFKVKDDDFGPDGQIRFNIESIVTDSGNNVTDIFSIKQDTGVLSLNQNLLKTQGNITISYYNVVIVASDRGQEPTSINGTLRIDIQPVRNQAPVFEKHVFSVIISEVADVGDVVVEVNVTDPEGKDITMNVLGAHSEVFSFNGTSMMLEKKLDFEKTQYHVVKIRSNDGDMESTSVVYLTVNNTFDEAPFITMEPNLTIKEELPVNTELTGWFSIMDSDKDDHLTYRLNGNDSDYLAIDANTGVLKVAQRLNADGENGIKTLHDLTLTVIDKGGNAANSTFTVTVENINDNMPKCSQSIYHTHIMENTSYNGSILHIDCHDDDPGDNNTMAAEFVNTNTNITFLIEHMHMFTNFSDVDYESLLETEMFLTVFVTDRPNTTTPHIEDIVIHILITGKNEFEPQWVAPSPDTNNTFPPVSVPRDAEIGSIITVFKAKDDDLGLDGQIRFSIESIETDDGNNVTEVFSIEPTAGILQLQIDLLKKSENITVSYYNVVIIASDRGQEARSINATLRIDIQPVTNQAPVFEKHVFSVIISEVAEVGEVVVEVNVTDPEGKDVTMNVHGAHTDVFSFNGTSMMLKSKLDFEKTQYYVVQIRSNNGEMESTSVVYITVINTFDEPPTITMKTNLTIKEELTVGTELTGWFSVTDMDEDDNLTFSLTGSSGNDSKYIWIDPSTGALTVAKRIDTDGVDGITMIQDLTLTVMDKGGNSVNISFNVTVENINDNVPKCSQSFYRRNFTENSTSESPLLSLNCTDLDDPTTNLSVRFLDSSFNETFSVEGLELFTNSSVLDYETMDSPYFILVLAITDSDDIGDCITSVVVHVQVVPKNEFSPQWVSPAINNGTFLPVSIAQDAQPGTVVAMFHASDEDGGVDGDVSYSLGLVTTDTGDNVTEIFYIEALSGSLYLNTSLLGQSDFKYYDIEVEAIDGGSSPNTVQGSVRVTVTHSGNQPPRLHSSLVKVIVSELSPIGEVIANISVVDPDGDNVTLTLKGNQSVFAFDRDRLILEGTLDYEKESSFVLEARASDTESETPFIIEITVGNEYDEHPQIHVKPNSSLQEEIPIGTSLGDLYTVTDGDSDDNFTFLLKGNDSDIFDINPMTGDLVLKSRLDYDGDNGQHVLSDLILIVTDKGGNSVNVSFNLSVVNINDNPPLCTQSFYRVNMTENTTYVDPLLTITCTDLDPGDENLTTHLLEEHVNSTFFLNGQQVLVNGQMDLETSQETQVFLTVTIDDQHGAESHTATVIVLVEILSKNEFAPEWLSPKVDNGTFPTVKINQDAKKGTVIQMFQANDQDTGNDGEIIYSLDHVTDDTGNNITGLFEISRKAGSLYLLESMLKQRNIKDIKYYDVAVKASDDDFTVQGKIRLTVKHSGNKPPYVEKSLYSVSVPESTSPGTTILNITATDPDGGNVTLNLADRDGGVFTFDDLQLNTLNQLDYENTTFYILHASASDGEHDVPFFIQVSVQNLYDEVPVVTMYETMEIQEEQPVGTILKNLFKVTDADEGDNLTYFLSGNDSSYFDMDTNSGDMTLSKRLDCDGVDGLHFIDDLVLTVADKGGNSENTSLNISIRDTNDNAPICEHSLYKLNVTENTVYHGPLLELSCTDMDSDDVNLTVSLLDNLDNNTFTLRGLALFVNGSDIDYEFMKQRETTYILNLKVEDRPGDEKSLTSFVVVLVEVLSKNEFPPKWMSPKLTNGTFPSMKIAQDVKKKTVITSVQATDEDAGPDGDVMYSLGQVTTDSGKNVSDLFAIAKTTGVLYLADSLLKQADIKSIKYYDIVIKARDGGTSPKSIEGRIRVTIKHSNNQPPFVEETAYKASVLESLPSGSTVANITATDPDGGNVTLRMVGKHYSEFIFEGHELKLSEPLDYEKKNLYVLEVRASDGENEIPFFIHVSVVNVFDEPPIITLADLRQVQEELPLGSSVLDLYTVNDRDVGDNLTFVLTGNDSRVFTLDPRSGKLFIAQRLDSDGQWGRQVLENMTLTVTDTGGLTTNVTFNVTVVDRNDNPPRCTPVVMKLTVTENSTDDIIPLNCTDRDTGQSGNFSLELIGNTSRIFTLNDSNLVIHCGNLDYETADQRSLLLSLRAIDKPEIDKPLTASVILQIKVLPKNEFDPKWKSPAIDDSGHFTNMTIMDSTPEGAVLTAYVGEDEDDGRDGDIIYTLDSVTNDKGSNASDVFSLEKTSGVLTLLKSQKDGKDFSEHYDLKVTASDQGDPPRSVSGTTRVKVHKVLPQGKFNQSFFEATVSEIKNIGDVAYTMPDISGGNMTFEVIEDGAKIFKADGSDIKLIKKLDYETKQYHVIKIRGSTSKKESTLTLVVSVENVYDEFPVITVKSPSIAEERQLGSVVGQLFSVTDKDVDDTLKYSLQGDDAQYFDIADSSGKMTMKQRIDYDGPNAVKVLNNLTLVVVDKGGNQANETLKITVNDINDNTPMFEQTVFHLNVTENGTNTLELANFTITDLDSGNNGEMNVSIGDTGGAEAGVFTINGTSLFVDSTRLDYDQEQTEDLTYILTVQAVDTPSNGRVNTGKTTVVVQVLSKNEFSPEWTSPVLNANSTEFPNKTVSEDVPVGTTVETFKAKDGDFGEDGELIYTIADVKTDEGLNASNVFTMDGSTGLMKTSSPLDHDKETGGSNFYDVTVLVSDSGTPPQSANGKIRVILKDVNDNSPHFNKSLYEVDVNCDANVGSNLTSFDTTDSDDGGSLTYSITKGSKTYFSVDQIGGILKLQKKPTTGNTKEQFQVLTVIAADKLKPALKTETHVVVKFQDCSNYNGSASGANGTAGSSGGSVGGAGGTGGPGGAGSGGTGAGSTAGAGGTGVGGAGSGGTGTGGTGTGGKGGAGGSGPGGSGGAGGAGGTGAGGGGAGGAGGTGVGVGGAGGTGAGGTGAGGGGAGGAGGTGAGGGGAGGTGAGGTGGKGGGVGVGGTGTGSGGTGTGSGGTGTGSGGTGTGSGGTGTGSGGGGAGTGGSGPGGGAGVGAGGSGAGGPGGRGGSGGSGGGGGFGPGGSYNGGAGGANGGRNGGGSGGSGGNGKGNGGGDGNGGSGGESCSTVDISEIENWALRGSCGLLSVGVIGSLLAVYKMKKSRNRMDVTPEDSLYTDTDSRDDHPDLVITKMPRGLAPVDTQNRGLASYLSLESLDIEKLHLLNYLSNLQD